MKYKVVSFITIMLLCINIFCFTAVAQLVNAEKNVSVEIPAAYTVINENNVLEYSDYLDEIGHTKSSFVKYIKDNRICLFAVDASNKHQITISNAETEFSKNTEDLSLLEDVYIGRIVSKIVGSEHPYYDLVMVNGVKFIRVTSVLNSSSGNYVTAQYITVKNGKLYTFTYSVIGEYLSAQDSAELEQIINGLKISSEKSKPTVAKIEGVAITVVISIIIIGLAILAIYISYTFFSELISKKNSSDVADYVKIKRRKFK